MTSLPDWLVERAALGEIPPASRDRIYRVDPRELADRIAQLRADNAAELAAHPAASVVAVIESRIADEAKRRTAHRRRVQLGWLGMLGAAATAAVLLVVFVRTEPRGARIEEPAPAPSIAPSAVVEDDTRAKGIARLVAFRQAGDRAERLEEDALVRGGDLIQLRYNAGGQRYGVIASVDGAGVVTLHHPVSENMPRWATALAAKPTTLPHAYALDDAPQFERFFFITAADPIDLQQSLAALRSLAARSDSATAPLELPQGLRQWSLRLRKPDRPSTNQTP